MRNNLVTFLGVILYYRGTLSLVTKDINSKYKID